METSDYPIEHNSSYPGDSGLSIHLDGVIF